MAVSNFDAGLTVMARIAKMDKLGRVVIPKEIRRTLQIGEEQTLLVEVREGEIILKPLGLKSDPVKAIAEMNLPVDVWEELEKQIEEGATQE